MQRATASALALLAMFAAADGVAQSNGPSGRNAWPDQIVDSSHPSEAHPSEVSSREVLLGTITTGKSRPQAAAADVPGQILADGLDALHRGDVMLGRRRLEAVIEAYPDSGAATAAREELSVLYNYGGRDAANHAPAPPARWVPTQSGVAPAGAREGIGSVGSGTASPVSPVADGGRVSFEARAREQQARRDERWLRALGFDFQMSAGDRVFFAESSADIGARSRAVLTAQARWLSRHPEVKVVIEAHADDDGGSRDDEIRISERRARAVQERLVDEGLEPSRITVVAFGRDRPVATCRAPECAAQNRRVITRIGALSGAEFGRRAGNDPALAVAPAQAYPDRRD